MNKEDLFKEKINEINKIWTEEYVRVLLLSWKSKNNKSYYSLLVNNDKVWEFLKTHSWDIHYWDWRPWFIFFWNDEYEYQTIWSDGTECLVYFRNWPWKSERIFEFSQEFVLYYDLYKDWENYIKIHNDGSEEKVILITENEVKIKLKYIKEYLAIKKQTLIVYFSFINFGDFQLDCFCESIQEEHQNYLFWLFERHFSKWEKMLQITWKKLIEWKKNFKPKLFDGEKNKYEDFYIWTDDDWEDMFFPCDPDKLANNFWANQDAPNYLTIIMFKREVLNKYYADPDKYTVWDSFISMEWFWDLNIDNNLDGKIWVFLWDLWRDIPYLEQKYWKNFEIKEIWKISQTHYKRNFEVKFCDAESPELYFKSKYKSFNKKWEDIFWWKFFKDFLEWDNHLLKSLHSLNYDNNQKEFDEQVLILTKILVDYLNEEEIYKNVKDKLKEKEDRGITKLEKFMISQNAENSRLIKFFKDLQFLRSKWSAHNKKDKDYKKALLNFWDETMSLKEIFDEILIQSVEMLNTLEIRFLK